MPARIYQPPKNAMQSGRGMSQQWVLEFLPDVPRRPDPLMGWISGSDTMAEVKLIFSTREEAIAYADRAGLKYEAELPQDRRIRPKAYADNFSWKRFELWTH
jgi:hypothetical protein